MTTYSVLWTECGLEKKKQTIPYLDLLHLHICTARARYDRQILNNK